MEEGTWKLCCENKGNFLQFSKVILQRENYNQNIVDGYTNHHQLQMLKTAIEFRLISEVNKDIKHDE